MSRNKEGKQELPASSEMAKGRVFRSHENSSGNSHIISDFRALEKKWQERWEHERIFEAVPDERKKYFCNYPYPYMNGFLHIGGSFTALRVDVAARYKRMRGYNVLFPFAFHCTGTPIVAAAERIAQNEPTQKRILLDMGIPEKDIPLFADTLYWTQFFPKETELDLRLFGMSVDWRRSFITTDLNPHYDTFIRWQFQKLKEKNYVVLGEHPVVWCPKCGAAVGDHARLEGEGETPQEYTLLKFKFGDRYIIAATLRPETVYGQTNLWVDPEGEYVEAEVDGEKWIVSPQCAFKLGNQNKKVGIKGKVLGKELLGKFATAPQIHKDIMILPSTFCDLDIGAGLVTSVPSDAPDDWMGLHDMQKDRTLADKYNLDFEEIKKIRPIAIIKSEGWGELPAVEICQRMGIQNQDERDKLEAAKHEIYKTGFYTGVMRQNCGVHAGMKVEQAKEEIKRDMRAAGEADIMFEPSARVVCRCLTPAIVKIVSNQWFLAYGNQEWKALAHKAVDTMMFYPEIVRKQFHYVVDWLNDWACTREFGLGTKLPWDENWVIESLSDSTIYMAYYTICHILQKIPPEKIDESLYDYIFLSHGSADEISRRIGIQKKILDEMKGEFAYWYPFDFRNSGKDLVQNHLTFCLFNHTAIFPEERWPAGFGVNGMMLVGMDKMSKSRGTAYPLRDVIERYGSDVTRFTLMYGGEGMDDPNWDDEFASSIGGRLASFSDFAGEHYGKGTSEERYVDRWLYSVVNRIIVEVTDAMEQTLYRTALQKGFFDMQRHLRWYMRRCGTPNGSLLAWFCEVQTKFLTPFTPHLAEEMWEIAGRHGFASLAEFPQPNGGRIDDSVEAAEEYVKHAIEDITEIIRVARIESPERVYIYTAEPWKWQVAFVCSSHKNQSDAMKALMGDPEMKKRGKEVSDLATKLFKERPTLHHIDEKAVLMEAHEFIAREVGVPLEIGSEYDPERKARFAMPMRPAIYIKQ